eukprot:m.102407 g.102407  ORF g.102407 m.102407 type:complete len:123 (-) comp13773_c0_seq1:172-540(-)
MKTLDPTLVSGIVDEKDAVEAWKSWENVMHEYFNKEQNGGQDVGNFHEIRSEIIRFLISLTMKDCSVMVTLSPCLDASDTQTVLLPATNQVFKVKISVVDLDYKRPSKIHTYLKAEDQLCKH